MNKPRWIKMPLADLIEPVPGRLVYGPRWWAVTEDGSVLFFKSYVSPQCNENRALVERLMLTDKDDRPRCDRVEYIARAFVPHNCQDYV